MESRQTTAMDEHNPAEKASPVLLEAQVVDHEAEAAMAAEMERLRKKENAMVVAEDTHVQELNCCRKKTLALTAVGIGLCIIILAISLGIGLSGNKKGDDTQSIDATNFSLAEFFVYASAVNGTICGTLFLSTPTWKRSIYRQPVLSPSWYQRMRLLMLNSENTILRISLWLTSVKCSSNT